MKPKDVWNWIQGFFVKDDWSPPVSMVEVEELAGCKATRVYVKKKHDGPLTIVLFDDVYELVIKDGSVPVGSDEYAVRIAIETLLNHPDVAEVIITNFYRPLPKLLSQHRQSQIEKNRLCVMLDVFNASGPVGLHLAKEYISDWKLPSLNRRQFSKQGNSDLENLGYEMIDKRVGKDTRKPYETMKDEIIVWVNDAAAPHKHPTKKILKEIEAKLQEIGEYFDINFFSHNEYRRRCHDRRTIGQAKSQQHCIVGLQETLKTCTATSDIIRLLTEAGLLTKSRDSLFEVIADSTRADTGIALCKCLSDYGTVESERSVPGHWIHLALGSRSSLEPLGCLQYAIRQFKLQPTYGFIEAIEAVGEWIRIVTLDDKVLNLDLEFKQDNDTSRALDDLQDIVVDIFKNEKRPFGGNTTQILQTFFDSGASMTYCEVFPDSLIVRLEMTLSEVR